MLWTNLTPEPGIVAALNHAGPRPESGDQHQKRRWSENFADGCAVAIANELRNHHTLRRKTIKPLDLQSTTEPLTPLGAGTNKRIDVTVADPLVGLEIGVSLKGFNFKDPSGGQYDKNITGRLYELGDEMRLVHEHLPHAFMIGALFLPIGSVASKSRSQSSFAHSVLKLRERTGRLDAAIMSHSSKCDAGYVALYTTGSEPEGYPPGLVRFLNVQTNPPKAGRPKVETTLSLSEFVSEAIDHATDTIDETSWADPEPD